LSAESGFANLALSCAFVDELAGNGLRHAIICPGSRSTPLAVAFANHQQIRTWVLIDERSAAFFALGMARQLRDPVAILCTSGTAAANFLPAVIEARLSRIPLIILTADRPPELRDWGAAQTIDQINLYGSHAKWFVDMPVPVDDPSLRRHARATAARAMLTSAIAPAGPVHLNVPFREPLLPVTMNADTRLGDLYAGGRDIVPPLPYARVAPRLPDETIAAIATIVFSTPRGIVVCGPDETEGLAQAAISFGRAAGYPVLADPLSGLRFGPNDRSELISAYDSFLRDRAIVDRLRPDLVIRVGAQPTSKPLQQFLASHPASRHLVIDAGSPRDPSHLATVYLLADPVDTLNRLQAAVSCRQQRDDALWVTDWLAVEEIASKSIATSLGSIEEFFEGRIASTLVDSLPVGATVVVGNSMPIRDVDTFVRGDQRDIRLLGARGASGIDGVVSSALGAAAVAAGPVALLIGDLSFYHDMNGLLAASRFGIALTVVVINNNGGGIFSFLPQAEQLDTGTFETLFGTPIGINISAVAELYGATYARPIDWSAFERELSHAATRRGLTIIDVTTNRARNVTLHRKVTANVVLALLGLAAVDA